MKTMMITGGTSGIGKEIAMHYLKKGDRVLVVGSSSTKLKTFAEEVGRLGAQDRAICFQADLSLVKENRRIIKEVENKISSLDSLILCAQDQKTRSVAIKTEEGFEFSFGLYYLSRYILSYGLIDTLAHAAAPVIINICAPGMKGNVHWDDVQSEKHFNSIKAIMHGSRLNDLLGVAFEVNCRESKINYVLFNPGAVQTRGATEAFEQPLMRMITKILYKIIGKPVDKAIEPIIKLLENPPSAPLSAFKQNKKISLNMETFNRNNAQRLHRLTEGLMHKV